MGFFSLAMLKVIIENEFAFSPSDNLGGELHQARNINMCQTDAFGRVYPVKHPVVDSVNRVPEIVLVFLHAYSRRQVLVEFAEVH